MKSSLLPLLAFLLDCDSHFRVTTTTTVSAFSIRPDTGAVSSCRRRPSCPLTSRTEHHYQKGCLERQRWKTASSSAVCTPLFSTSQRKTASSAVTQQPTSWMQQSFPEAESVDDNGEKDPGSDIGNDDPVVFYDLGIAGHEFDTGVLAERFYNALTKITSSNADPELLKGYRRYALELAVGEAVRAAFYQNGLRIAALDDDEETEVDDAASNLWNNDVTTLKTIELLPTDGSTTGGGQKYSSLDEAAIAWTPGQTFHVEILQIPTRIREWSVDDFLEALDPSGDYHEQAQAAGMLAESGSAAENNLATLSQMVAENKLRTETSPLESVPSDQAYAGMPRKRGYRVIHADQLAKEYRDSDATGDGEKESVLMHVMDALVSHGCLLVDLTNGGKDVEAAETMAKLWKVTEDIFSSLDAQGYSAKHDIQLPGMTTIFEAGSVHAKVGFASSPDGNMRFVETRLNPQTSVPNVVLYPTEANTVLGETGVETMAQAFARVARVGQDVVRIAVAASSWEAGVLESGPASQAALLLAEELVDNGRPLADDTNKDADDEKKISVAMSPHRLCRYTNMVDDHQKKKNRSSTREIFGAHTDSTFVTMIPVAAVAGLEVYDEDAEQWYRPELAARRHWEEQSGDQQDGSKMPWHAPYVVVMPGEFLQIATRNEILAAVHRVVATKEQPARYSSPILLRARSGQRMDVERYLGSLTDEDLILKECDGMTLEAIHDAMQP